MLDRDRVERSPFERSPAERLFTLAAVVSAAQLLWVLAMGLIAGGQFVPDQWPDRDPLVPWPVLAIPSWCTIALGALARVGAVGAAAGPTGDRMLRRRTPRGRGSGGRCRTSASRSSCSWCSRSASPAATRSPGASRRPSPAPTACSAGTGSRRRCRRSPSRRCSCAALIGVVAALSPPCG